MVDGLLVVRNLKEGFWMFLCTLIHLALLLMVCNERLSLFILLIYYNLYLFLLGDLNPGNVLSMGTIVTIMVQTVEHYFMQFNTTKARTENRKSPIQVITYFIHYNYI